MKLNKAFSFIFQQLLEALKSFIVVERDGSIIACAALFPFFEDKSGEVAAIAVSEECRGQGQGDKLLGKTCKSTLLVCSVKAMQTSTFNYLSQKV